MLGRVRGSQLVHHVYRTNWWISRKLNPDWLKLITKFTGPGGSLRMYLERLATVENVQKFIEENPFGQRAVTCKNPSWRYYMNMMKANRFRMPM